VRTRDKNDRAHTDRQVRHSEVTQLLAQLPPSLDRKAATYGTPKFMSEMSAHEFFRASTLLRLYLETVEGLSSCYASQCTEVICA
jgi:hypothetical protein